MGLLDSFMAGVMNSASGTSSGGRVTLGEIVFPISPSAIEVSVKQDHGSVNINNYGEYLMLGKTGLKSCTLESLWPAEDYSFAVTSVSMSPEEFVAKIEAMRTAGKICSFSMSGSPIDFRAVVGSFRYGYKDSSDDIYFSLGLKEYRYIEGTAPKELDSKTGLNKRPETFLEKVGKSVNYYPGDNPLACISRAVGAAAGTTKACQPYLKQYKNVMKGGGIKPGNILQATSSGMKIDGIDLSKTILY